MSETSDSEIIHLIDDQPEILNSLIVMLQSKGHVTAAYLSAEQFIEQAEFASGGCVVIDFKLPGMDGLELQRRLEARASLLPVIMISGRASVPVAVTAMRQGAVAFLEKPCPPGDLEAAIQQALERNRASRARAMWLAEMREKMSSLTETECRVLEKILDGKANKVIARDLDMAQRSVERARARILAKLGVPTTIHAVRLVTKYQLKKDLRHTCVGPTASL